MMIQASSIASMYSNSYTSSANSASQNSGARGMKGPGGPPPGGPPKGPDLDTDSDGLWSETEISKFASDTGLSLDVSEIISKYDTDGDGAINSSEREALARDNALQLPKPEEMMQMREQALNVSSSNNETQNIIDILSQTMETYSASSKYREDIISMFDAAM